ncbi:MAG: hypothetical protein ABR552_04535 [Actinomycetota bacterium]
MATQPTVPPEDGGQAAYEPPRRRRLFMWPRSSGAYRDGTLADTGRPVESRREVYEQTSVLAVRGGVSLWSDFTGMMTALGALLVGAAITGGIVAAGKMSGTELQTSASRWGLWTAVAFCAAVFLAFLWGGYAAGRMARGMGMLNGLLMVIMTLAIGAGVIALIDWLGAHVALSIGYFGTFNIPLTGTITTAGIITGIVALALMVIGSMMGAMMGARWHTRLEDTGSARPRGRRIAA